MREMPCSFKAMRYHSFGVTQSQLPPDVVRTGFAEDDDELMAMEHQSRGLYGVQFHPESVGTPAGRRIIRNFVAVKALGESDG